MLDFLETIASSSFALYGSAFISGVILIPTITGRIDAFMTKAVYHKTANTVSAALNKLVGHIEKRPIIGSSKYLIIWKLVAVIPSFWIVLSIFSASLFFSSAIVGSRIVLLNEGSFIYNEGSVWGVIEDAWSAVFSSVSIWLFLIVMISAEYISVSIAMTVAVTKRLRSFQWLIGLMIFPLAYVGLCLTFIYTFGHRGPFEPISTPFQMLVETNEGVFSTFVYFLESARNVMVYEQVESDDIFVDLMRASIFPLHIATAIFAISSILSSLIMFLFLLISPLSKSVAVLPPLAMRFHFSMSNLQYSDEPRKYLNILLLSVWTIAFVLFVLWRVLSQ